MILFLLTHLLDTYRLFSCDYSSIHNWDVAIHIGMSESIGNMLKEVVTNNRKGVQSLHIIYFLK